MKKFVLPGTILGGILIAMLQVGAAQAQATRTWVSGVGDDANPCSRTAPCKTFAGAISKTAAGGEIDVLDPGGFGAVTITKAITIDGGGGIMASVLVSGTNGIIINAGVNDTVVLRNLHVQGLGTGLSAVRLLAASTLIVDRCDISGFTTGVDVAVGPTTNVGIRNTTFDNISGTGVNAVATTGAAVVQVSNSSFGGRAVNNTQTGTGLNAGNSSVVTVSNSRFAFMSVGAQASGTGNLSIDGSLFSTIFTAVNSGASTTVAVSNNTLVNNTTGFQVAGTFLSAGNNKVIGGTPGTPNGTIVQK